MNFRFTICAVRFVIRILLMISMAGGFSSFADEKLRPAHLLDGTYNYGGLKVAWAPPAFANKRVFARSDKELVCASLEAKP